MVLSERRFEHVNFSNPEAVKALDDEHPAIRERRPMFPGQVVSAQDAPRLLVDARNNRKIGATVETGPAQGLPDLHADAAGTHQKPLQVEIRTVWREGYFMPPASKQRLRAAIAELKEGGL